MRHTDHGPELPPGQLLLALALLDGAALGPAELALRVGEVLRPPRGVAAGQDALQERDHVPRMDIGRLEAQIRLIGHGPPYGCCLESTILEMLIPSNRTGRATAGWLVWRR